MTLRSFKFLSVDQKLTSKQKQKQQQAENADGGAAKKKKVTAAQLRVQRGNLPPLFYSILRV
jgi:hypothetical protein